MKYKIVVAVFGLLVAGVSLFINGDNLRAATPDGEPLVPNLENRFTFEPIEVVSIRVVLHRTPNMTAPALDEIEVFGPDMQAESNFALAKSGAEVVASSCISGYDIHKIDRLNDGKFGNSFAWVADESDDEPWVQVNFPKSTTISQIVLSRDRLGEFPDRTPASVELWVSIDGKSLTRLDDVRATRKASPLAKKFQRKNLRWAEVVLPNKIPAAPGDATPVAATVVSVNLPKNWPNDTLNFENLALRKTSKPQASSAIAGYEIHKIEHLNDGKLGNDHSWIAGQNPCWAEIDLGHECWVYRVAFGSDSSGKFQDRGTTLYSILVATEYDTKSDAATWQKVAPGPHPPSIQYRTEFCFTPVKARYVRVAIEQTSYNMPARIDELEVFGRDTEITLAEIGPLDMLNYQAATTTETQSSAKPIDAEKMRQEWETTLVDEEYAWLKAFGRADIDPGLTNTPYPIRKHPLRVPDDQTTLVTIKETPKLDGKLNDLRSYPGLSCDIPSGCKACRNF